MSSNPGPSSNKEDTSQSARPTPVSYTETTGVDDEFARKLQGRQSRLEHAEAGQEIVQPIQPKDTKGMANVNAELQRKLQKWKDKSESTIG